MNKDGLCPQFHHEFRCINKNILQQDGIASPVFVNCYKDKLFLDQ